MMYLSKPKALVKKYEIPREELKRQIDEIFKEADLDALLEATGVKCHNTLKSSDIVKGKVIQIRHDAVLVDYGGKVEATLPYYEDGQANEDLDVGDETDFLVNDIKGNHVHLSRKNVELLKRQNEILKNLRVGDRVSGKLIHHTKNGWLVNINGLPALLPSHQEFLITPEEGPEALLDTEVLVEVDSIDDKMVTVTRKPFAVEVKKKAKKSFLSSLTVGDLVTGTIKNITEFGAFIQIASGVIGMCHASDFGDDEPKVGNKTKSRVLKIDRDKNRVSLGIRQVTEPSWKELVDKYSLGDKVMAEVKSIVPYGAFLEIEPGVSGLVHVSDLSWSDHIKHPKDVISQGETVEVVILGMDIEKQHLSLGLKQVIPDPWETTTDRYLIGQFYKGIVVNKAKFGIFVELEQGLEGLAHHTVGSENLRVGEQVTVSILRIDTIRKKISLGLEI